MWVIKRCFSTLQRYPERKAQDWSDFIGCMDAEPDLSRNYKTYLGDELDEKYGHR